MWESYYKFRSSVDFSLKWIDHLSPIGGSRSDPCPILYQFVTDAVMEELLKRYFPVETIGRSVQATLDYEEHNALRYMAGYVIRSLTKKVDRSSHPLKTRLALCLQELGEEDSDGEHPSEDWLKNVDRGGLKHVNDATYLLFTAMEETLRQHIGSGDANSQLNIKNASTVIMDNDDVLFHWAMISVNWNEEEASALLSMMVEHWITLRGFSFASAFIEKYKQSCKKNIQKSKGFRKRLQTA